MKKLMLLMITVCMVNLVEAQELPDYKHKLNPGDGIRIIFYNISEKISGDYYINLDETIQLPFLGTLKTKEKTFDQIRDEVFSMYDSLYREPELTILPLIKINITGEIRQPGFYYITGVEKLSGLFALAGGETADSDIEGAYIIRDNKEIEMAADTELEDANIVKDIGLRSGDRVVVPRKWWVGARNTAVIISGAAVVVTLVGLFIR